jgi:hypothetical protein
VRNITDILQVAKNFGPLNQAGVSTRCAHIIVTGKMETLFEA